MPKNLSVTDQSSKLATTSISKLSGRLPKGAAALQPIRTVIGSVSATPPIIDLRIAADGPIANADGSHEANVRGFTREATKVSSPTFGNATAALVAGDGSSMTIPSDVRTQAMQRFAVEMLICPGAISGDVDRLIESQSTPFSLSLAPGSQAGRFHLVGSLHLRHTPQRDRSGWFRVEAKDVARQNAWITVALIWDGDCMTLLVDGEAVARRSFRNAEMVALDKVAATHFWVGTWVDGQRNRYVGKIAGLRVWNTVPDKYAAELAEAEERGLGAIDSRHDDFGGDGGDLGPAKGPEQTFEGGRWRSYERGVIAWKPDTGARVIHDPMHTTFVADRARASLGYPIADEVSNATVRVMYFEKGAIYWSKQTGTGAVWGEPYLRYLSKTAVLGLPRSPMPFGSLQNPDMTTQFERGRIHYAPHTGAHEVHGLILEHYTTLQGTSGLLGFPVSDEEPIYNQSGTKIGVVSVFEGGAIYFSDRTGAHEVHGEILKAYRNLGGPTGELGFPTTDERGAANGVRYSGFEHGVIVWRAGWKSAKAVREYEVYVKRAGQHGEVDDGALDSSGEYYGRVTLTANGQTIADRERFPRSGHSNASLKIDKRWTVPIRHDTTLYLKVDIWDHDEASDDDYHGRIEKQYDVNTLWGTLGSDPTIDGEVGLHENQPMTTKGSSSPKLSSIQFDYTISTKAQAVDRNLFRNQGWWKFDNFKTPHLGWDLYPQTFRDVDIVTDFFEAVLNPFDALYYELAFKGAASGGNCFGMSAEALCAHQGHSMFPEHIYRFERSSAQKHINIKQASQLGAEMLQWVIRNVLNGNLIQPIDVFNEARREIDRGRPCIISMMNLENGTGHAVLAYDYALGGPNKRHGCLYVADPNKPWSDGTGHPTYIEVFKNNSFTARTIATANNPNGFASNEVDLGLIDLPTTLIMAVPYRVVSGVPRTPFWEIVAALLGIGVFLILAGDAEAEQVSVGGDDLFVNGQRNRVKRNHSLFPLGLLDGEKPPLLLAGRQRLGGLLELDVRGKAQGRYRQAGLLGPAGFVLDNPIAANARDSVRIEDPNSAYPLLSLDIDGATKAGSVDYFVVRDPNARPSRRFTLSLQQAKDDVARVGVDPRGGALVISPGGAPQPMDIQIVVADGGQLRTGTLRGVMPTAGTEALRIVPEDWANPKGNFAVERLTSLSGGVIERKSFRGA